MPKFEVFIPAAGPAGFNVTLKVGADNWMAALKAGMQKLGEQGASSANVMVDIQEDDSIHVTDASTGRVFRIRELSDAEAAAAPVKRPSGIFRPAPAAAAGPTPRAPVREDLAKTQPMIPAVVPQRPAEPKPPAAQPASLKPTEPRSQALVQDSAASPQVTTRDRPAPPPPRPAQQPALQQPAAQQPAPQRPPAARPADAGGRPQYRSSPRIDLNDVEELERPMKPVTGSIGRARSAPNAARDLKQAVDDMLSDVFLRVTELAKKKSVEEAMSFILDLAMEKVPCESGSVLKADGFSGDLSFVTARGPKAQEVMRSKMIVPAGVGIAGFCASEGVSVAVSDVQKDPRFYAAVGEKLGYETKSLACSPMMTHGRSFGCVQLINRKGGPQFLEHEVGVLSYLSHQASLYLNGIL